MALTTHSRKIGPTLGWLLDSESIHSAVKTQITDGKLDKVVHINRLHHRIQPILLRKPSHP